jgi:hypothetical protein
LSTIEKPWSRLAAISPAGAASRRQSQAASGRARETRCGRQRLIEIRYDVVDMLDADRKADEARRYAGSELILALELRMGGRRRVDGEAA